MILRGDFLKLSVLHGRQKLFPVQSDERVLSDDPTRVEPNALADIEVLATVVGGEAVWDAGLGIGDPA